MVSSTPLELALDLGGQNLDRPRSATIRKKKNQVFSIRNKEIATKTVSGESRATCNDNSGRDML